jgi:hypothetical protein
MAAGTQEAQLLPKKRYESHLPQQYEITRKKYQFFVGYPKDQRPFKLLKE